MRRMTRLGLGFPKNSTSVAFHDLAVGDFPFEPVFMSNIQNSTFNCTHMVRMPLSVKSRFRKRDVEPAPGPGEVTSLSGNCVNCGWSPPSCRFCMKKVNEIVSSAREIGKAYTEALRFLSLSRRIISDQTVGDRTDRLAFKTSQHDSRSFHQPGFHRSAVRPVF